VYSDSSYSTNSSLRKDSGSGDGGSSISSKTFLFFVRLFTVFISDFERVSFFLFLEGFITVVSSLFSNLESSKVLSISLLFNSSTKNTAKANLNIIKRYEFKVIAG
jgi:hypothetical protein